MTPRAELHRGNCVDVLAELAPGGIDACITDPPYGISAPGAEAWDAAAAPDRAWSMVWEALRPGGAIAVFTARRNYHRVATALEDRGYAVDDMLVWLFGTGRASGRRRLRAAHDPIVLACKGAGPLHLDVEAGRLPGSGRWPVTVAHDGSAAVAESLPSLPRGRGGPIARSVRGETGVLAKKGWHGGSRTITTYGDPAGSAARYFYCAPASRAEREAGLRDAPADADGRRNPHPTRKPLVRRRGGCMRNAGLDRMRKDRGRRPASVRFATTGDAPGPEAHLPAHRRGKAPWKSRKPSFDS